MGITFDQQNWLIFLAIKIDQQKSTVCHNNDITFLLFYW